MASKYNVSKLSQQQQHAENKVASQRHLEKVQDLMVTPKNRYSST